MGRCQRRVLSLALALLAALAAAGAGAGVLDQLERLGGAGAEHAFLPPDEAFRMTDTQRGDGALVLEFAIAPGYYLYRERFAFDAADAALHLGKPQMPAAEQKDDPEFGRVAVYKHDMRIIVPVLETPARDRAVDIEVRYQGCAEDGICYPPIRKTIAYLPSAAGSVADAAVMTAASTGAAAGASVTDRIAVQLGERSLAMTLLTFLGLGLLLALTPCVFPMVPILSGIIVGQRDRVSTPRALGLSAVYVVAMAATYALAGVVAGLAGRNLQAAFQQPAVIVAFSALFVVLALSMFGFFELQLPARLQSRLDRYSRAQQGGGLLGVAVMGALSAIIVGPCVAPPLAGALAYIGTTGSAFTGGAALFALGLGMGLPLLAVGASAGALLPRAGQWMKRVKQAFGVVFLGVAIVFLERILPGPLTLILWAALLLGSGIALGALVRTETSAGAAPRLAQALGLAALVWAAALLVGAAAGADDPLRPLAPFAGTAAGTGSAHAPLRFRPVANVAEVEAALRGSAGPVMLDFYADWCVECKHLERETFAAPAVAARLHRYTLLRADVTADDDANRALLAHFGLYGPPAVLFFRDGAERRAERLVGFIDASGFGALLDRLEHP